MTVAAVLQHHPNVRLGVQPASLRMVAGLTLRHTTPAMRSHVLAAVGPNVERKWAMMHTSVSVKNMGFVTQFVQETVRQLVLTPL